MPHSNPAKAVMNKNKKEALLQAAKDLFGECGYVETTFKKISDKAGVALGLLTHHYGNKEKLFLASGLDVLEHFLVKLRTATAEATFRGDFFADGFVLGKNVKSQRMSHGIYLSDYFFYRIKSKDRHYRTEDFFLHYGIFEGYLIHDSRFNL